MAGNVGYTPGTGATVAADEIAGVLHQRIKIGIGTDGSATDVSSSNPMPVTGTVTANTGLSQPLTDAQLRAATVPISGTVTANTGLSQPLTDSQLRAAAVPVSGTFFQATQPVSAASLPLPSGAATAANQTTGNTSLSNIDGKLPALVSSRVPVDGSGVTQPVSGTFWQATQPVSIASSVPVTGPLTDAQLRASTVPISGTVTANTGLSQPLTDAQLRASAVPISGTVTANTGLTQPLTDTQLRAAAVPVSGPLTDTQLRATAIQIQGTVSGTAVPVSGTFFQATQPVSGTVTANTGLSQPLTDAQLRASAVPVSVGSIALPTGASTLSEQQTQTSWLSSIELATSVGAARATDINNKTATLVSGRVPVDGSGVTQPVSGTFWQTTQPVSAASLPLPSGASTSALQTTGNTSLSNIDGKLPALIDGLIPVDGSLVVQPISATSLPLPSGASTSALQAAGNASLALIAEDQDEAVGAIQALRMAIDSLTRTIGMVQPDTAARMRVAVDSITGGLTLGTVTTVTTVSTLTNQSQVGTFAANDQIPAMMHLPYETIRRNISVT